MQRRNRTLIRVLTALCPAMLATPAIAQPDLVCGGWLIGALLGSDFRSPRTSVAYDIGMVLMKEQQ